MKKKDIQVSKVYAYQRGSNWAPVPIVVLDTSHLWTRKRPGSNVATVFEPSTMDRPMTGHGYTSRDHGYAVAVLDAPLTAENVDILRTASVEEFKSRMAMDKLGGDRQGVVRYEIQVSLTQIRGEFWSVFEEYHAAREAERELAHARTEASRARYAKIKAAAEVLEKFGIHAQPTPGTLALSADEATKLVAIMTASEQAIQDAASTMT